MSRRRIAGLTVAGIVLVALLAFAASTLTPYQEVIEQGPAPQVRGNPYLAAERFLLDQGREVTHAQGFAGLGDEPSDDQILLLLGERAHMTPSQSVRLLEWVAEGGHLVFVAERLWDERTGKSGDLLLDALNLQQYETTDNETGTPAEPTATTDARTPLTRLFLENEDAPAYFAFDTAYHLYDAGKRAHAWANSDGATHMLQLRHGNGLITALTDSWIWHNDSIGQYDHAWLLWYLTQDRDVTLAYRTDHDSLLRQLLRYFPEALAALSCMLLFAAWHLAARQGPTVEAAARDRRQLQEHLRASADFLYRHAGQRHLLLGLQRDIQRQASRRHPTFDTQAFAEQCQVLAKLSHLPPEHIDQAMRPPGEKPARAAEFTRQIARLQSLRNAL
ncbi:DUF4350 domain-containing protein [Stutzerimonas stutzeri]|uniref:DUF4350 domain-containing protein n=1 Tax=Stutzerimonas stutzeri TaxID=316 RepID=A0A6I6LND3_STUST|nr:DUF4350 domain-containing protein [Stutzerimonas stutzeri]QGZ32269.1 DUF4350 domain-containing protein [Stutzerimonas stutzeri]